MSAACQPAGVVVMGSVTALLRAVLRETDTVARLGRDEFAVLTAVAEAGDAMSLAERIRAGVAIPGGRPG